MEITRPSRFVTRVMCTAVTPHATVQIIRFDWSLMRSYVCALIILCFSVFAIVSAAERRESAGPRTASLTLSTSNPEARKLYEARMADLENVHIEKALDNWRAALRKDPSLALAHLFISESTYDPAEQSLERAKARALAGRASPGEQLLIRWLTEAQEGRYIPAIAAMNDLLAKYPRDKRLAFLTGRWLNLREQYEQGARLLERAVALDVNYAAAWNQLGYTYAHSGSFSKSFAAMEK